MTLTLKQMQDLGMNQYFSDKEVDKQISKALEEQVEVLKEQSKDVVQQDNSVYTDIVLNYAKEETLEYVIVNGGTYSYKLNGKTVKLSVLTQDDLLLN